MRGGSSVGQTGLLLGDSLFSKELENMGKQLAGRHFCVVGMYVCIYKFVCGFISGFNDESHIKYFLWNTTLSLDCVNIHTHTHTLNYRDL